MLSKLKLIYKIKTSNSNQNKRISSKTLKVDESNQYSTRWQNHYLTVALKSKNKIKKNSSVPEFNIILNNISHTNKIGHLFIVDIKFHFKNEKNLLFNKLYTSIFEKSKLTKPYGRKISALTFKCFLKKQRKIYKYI